MRSFRLRLTCKCPSAFGATAKVKQRCSGVKLMDQFSFLYLLGLVPAAAAVFILIRAKSRARIRKLPQFCIGAIRVTDRQGRDMLIIRKDDGSFEMCEEEKIRKQCVL